MEERNYTVYMHKNKINGKVYIGITKQIPKKRWNNGKGYKNQIFEKAIDKYGWNNFEHIILFEHLNKEQAEQEEIKLIAQYKSNQKEFGYNISKGGKASNGVPCSEEKKLKISKKNKGTKNGMYGKKPWNYGKPISDEQKQLLIDSRKGLKAWNKGKKMNDEDKLKISISTKKAMQRPEIKEKLHKPKTIINKNRWKKVFCIETNEIFESVIQASKNKKCKDSDISKVCKGKRKTCAGYHWRYYEE